MLSITYCPVRDGTGATVGSLRVRSAHGGAPRVTPVLSSGACCAFISVWQRGEAVTCDRAPRCRTRRGLCIHPFTPVPSSLLSGPRVNASVRSVSAHVVECRLEARARPCIHAATAAEPRLVRGRGGEAMMMGVCGALLLFCGGRIPGGRVPRVAPVQRPHVARWSAFRRGLALLSDEDESGGVGTEDDVVRIG